jgi:hypothetical protein
MWSSILPSHHSWDKWQAYATTPSHWLTWKQWTCFCLVAFWITTLLISSSQVARIAGLSHHAQPVEQVANEQQQKQT